MRLHTKQDVKSVSQLLMMARDELRAHGWAQFTLESITGCLCLTGAVSRVCQTSFVPNDVLRKAVATLQHIINTNCSQCRPYKRTPIDGGIQVHNDFHITDGTEAEILLHAAAQYARAHADSNR